MDGMVRKGLRVAGGMADGERFWRSELVGIAVMTIVPFPDDSELMGSSVALRHTQVGVLFPTGYAMVP